MRKISANYIFPVSGPPHKNGIVVVEKTGKILEVIDTGGDLREIAGLEFYNGIIVPGFVNTHCHLELSHLKNQIPGRCGLDQFIFHISTNRASSKQVIRKAIENAHLEMIRNGIVAVGDISNTSDSFDLKVDNKIRYHTFLEVYGLKSKMASDIINQATKLSSLIQKKYPHPHTIVPHAPYSVSPDLFRQITLKTKYGPISIHNQESSGEILLFKEKKGALFSVLSKLIPELKKWKPEFENSLRYSLEYLKGVQQILLVHNTYTTYEDILLAGRHNSKIFWVLCPNTNLYIEDQLPDIPLFIRENLNISLGTDSLASNSHLSILSEMKTVSKYFPEIHIEEIVRWGTLNGAKALNMNHELGTIEKGKKPGLNLISNLDLQKIRLTDESVIRKII